MNVLSCFFNLRNILDLSGYVISINNTNPIFIFLKKRKKNQYSIYIALLKRFSSRNWQ